MFRFKTMDEMTGFIPDLLAKAEETGDTAPEDGEKEDAGAPEDGEKEATDTPEDREKEEAASGDKTESDTTPEKGKEGGDTDREEETRESLPPEGEDTEGDGGTESLILSTEAFDHIAVTDTCIAFGVFFLVGLLLARMTWGRLR